MESLKDLAKLISDSAKQIEDSCARRGVALPALEDPATTANDVAFDDPLVKQAAGNIVAAAAQLTALVRPPTDTLQCLILGSQTAAALRVVVKGHIVEILKPHGRAGLHADEIAKQSGINSNRLARILHLLASEHILTEVSHNVFALNRVSAIMDTGKTPQAIRAAPEDKYVGTDGVAANVDFMGHLIYKAAAYLPEHLLDPANTSDSLDPPFNRVFNTTMWEYLERPENTHELRLFGLMMRGISKSLPSPANGGFDFTSLPAGSKVADVGGGVGSQSMVFARAYPHLKYVVQDRGSSSNDMHTHWNAGYPEALASGQVSFQAIDLFSEQPAKDVALFFVRLVLHNWPDDKCIAILKNLRAAAQPDTRLLILEVLLSSAVPSQSAPASLEGQGVAVKPPAPLLLNAGNQGVLLHMYDMIMMGVCMGGAQERTLDQFNALFAASGWKTERVYRQPYYVIGTSQIVAAPA
ncbi:hypothetical protein EIP91_000498 [Steccherinum ochraceum]|uniref:Uncharacterized protein n=1 Tax=Steccherinum ochraceum TaxID=92696 RepID=A0A4R0RQ45_9APHY|nr:hypothetical protein EIP91_000498 [Steccherinum ochraceum]